MNGWKRVIGFLLIGAMAVSLLLITGCNSSDYVVTIHTDRSTIEANGRDKIKLSAEVQDRNGNKIETSEVEFYEGNTLIVYPEEYRTRTGGRHELYAKYKDAVSKPVQIRAKEVPASHVTLTADTWNIRNDGSDGVQFISQVFNPEGEPVKGKQPQLYRGSEPLQDTVFRSSQEGIYLLQAKYEDSLESNIIAVNVAPEIPAGWQLTLEAERIFLLGVSDSIPLKATLTDPSHKKMKDHEIQYFVGSDPLKDNRFRPEQEGSYAVYAVCNGLVSNTVMIQAKKPEFIPGENSTVPVVIINTEGRTINSQQKVDATMTVYDSPEGINQPQDRPALITDIRIRLRGQSSLTFPKKQYGITLKDQFGEDYSYPLLGMGKEEDWVLNGSYADKSLMRNHIAYALGEQVSVYAPKTRFCEVYVNECNDPENPYNYMGIYLMIEKIKIDSNRVDLDKLKPDVTAGEKLTGGYLVAKDKVKEGEPFIDTSRGQYTFVSPKYEKMNSQQIDYISRYMNDFANAVFGEEFQDPKKGYARYLDLESYAEVLAINEFTKNIDGMHISLYYYKPRGEKLHAGPIWDFDLSMGNTDYRTGTDPKGWYCVSLDEYPRRILQDNAFVIMFRNKWNALRQTVLQDEAIEKIIDNALDTISGGPLERSLERWPGQWNGMFVWPNVRDENYTNSMLILPEINEGTQYMATYEEEIANLRSFLLTRAAWMDENIQKDIDLEPVYYDWINEYTGERYPLEQQWRPDRNRPGRQ